MNRAKKVYIALDVETTGPLLGVHSMLSIGACIIPEGDHSLEDLERRGGTFYQELKPMSLNFSPPAIRVGASELDALKPEWRSPTFYPKHDAFQPARALAYLQDSKATSFPATAMREFEQWMKGMRAAGAEVVPVVDTTFFDSGWINYYCALAGREPMFGHKGLDLASIWIGYTGDFLARVGGIPASGKNERPHHALHDAFHLAKQARQVFFGKMPYGRLPR